MMNMMKSMVAKTLCICLAAGMAVQAQSSRETGPTTLLITYRCAPSQRVTLRSQMEGAGLARFQHWKETGILAEYRILFSRYVDTDNWDMMAILSFPSYAEVERWKRVERVNPAGLLPEALALVIGINSYAADAVRQNWSDAVPPLPVYLVIPFEVHVAAPDYLRYLDDYVKPQLDGWIQEGVLARYDILMQRYATSQPWDSLIVLEYKDEAGLGAREKVMAKVRARLQSDGAFAAANDRKQDVRTEKLAMVADELGIAK